jgi:YbbR domain-containing protein
MQSIFNFNKFIDMMKKNIYVVVIAVLFSALLWGSISLTNNYITTIELPIRITNFPEGYATATALPEKIDIKVRGQGWKLVYLNLNADAEYRISSGRDRGRRFVNLYNYVLENQWLTSGVDVISIYPDTLSFIVERVEEKRVQVRPDIKLNYKKGYGLADRITLTPDSITIYAPASLLKEINVVTTEQVELNNLDSRLSREVAVKEIPGVTFPERTISVNLDVQRIMEKSFENINVEVRDIPGDRDVVLLPGKITVGIRGGIDVIAKTRPEDFTAYVQYRDVVLDTLGSIKPRFTYPDNTQLIFTKPERLRYVIKKFR